MRPSTRDWVSVGLMALVLLALLLVLVAFGGSNLPPG